MPSKQQRTQLTRAGFLLAVLAVLLCPGSLGSGQAMPDDARERERQRFIEKIKEINRWGPDAPIVGNTTRNLDEVIADGVNAEFLIGWGLTRDGQAYRFTWKNNRFAFEKLSPEITSQQGFDRMSVSVKHLSPSANSPAATTPPPAPAGANPPPAKESMGQERSYTISEASLGEPSGVVRAGKPLRGRVRVSRRAGAPASVVVALKDVQLPGSVQSLFTYPKLPAGSREFELVFEFSWPDSFPRQGELSGTLAIVTTPQVGSRGQIVAETLSNEVKVSFRVAP